MNKIDFHDKSSFLILVVVVVVVVIVCSVINFGSNEKQLVQHPQAVNPTGHTRHLHLVEVISAP